MDFPSEWTGKNFSDCDKIRPMNLSKITRNVFRGDTPRADQYDFCETWVYAWSSIWVFEWLPPKDRHQPPLNILWLPMFDNPVFPIPVKLLMRDVQAALETIRGRNIYVHCAMCRHRGVVTGVDEFLSKPQRQTDHANHFRIWYTFPMPLRILLLLALTLVILLAACQPFYLTTTPAVPMAPSIDTPQPSVIGSPTLEPTLITIEEPTLTLVSMETPNLNATLEHSRTPLPTSTPLPAALFLDPADWHHWPVIPIVPEYARQIYYARTNLWQRPSRLFSFWRLPVRAERLPRHL